MLLEQRLKSWHLWQQRRDAISCSRTDPDIELPLKLTEGDLFITKRSPADVDGQRELIAREWNNKNNADLPAVAQAIANAYKSEVNKAEWTVTTWALLIRQEDYQYDPEVKSRLTHNGAYNEYAFPDFPGEYLCVLLMKEQDFKNQIENARYIRSNVFKQNGYCAEQNVRPHLIYAPPRAPSRKKGSHVKVPNSTVKAGKGNCCNLF